MYERTAFSPTFLKNYQSCPYGAVHDTFNPSDPKNFGDIIHDILFRMYSTLGEKTIAEWQEIADKELRTREFEYPEGKRVLPYKKYLDKLHVVFRNLTHVPEFAMRVGDEILDLESANAPEGFSQVLYGSRCLTVPVFENGRKLRGKIDRIDFRPPNKIRIIDYKTGVSKNDSFQVLCYSIMLAIAYDLDLDNLEVEGVYRYLEGGKDETVAITMPEIADHHTRLCRLVSAYRTGMHVKRPGWDACKWCGVECPEGRKYKRS